jgi:hypothetical protein
MESLRMPAGLNRGVPRDVRLTAGGKFVYIAAVALLVASLAAVLVLRVRGVQENEERQLLIEHGAVADAQIVRLWRGSNEQNRPSVAYRFTVDGREYQGQARVSLTKWRALKVDEVLPVRYVPDRPDLSAPDGIDRQALPLWVPYLAGTPLAIGGLVCLFVVRTERRLLENGRPATAVVTGHRKHRSSEGGTHRSMTYEFRLPSGAAAKGKSSTSSKPPAIGSSIWVVYDPDRPRRSKPYPFQLVRASVE